MVQSRLTPSCQCADGLFGGLAPPGPLPPMAAFEPASFPPGIHHGGLQPQNGPRPGGLHPGDVQPGEFSVHPALAFGVGAGRPYGSPTGGGLPFADPAPHSGFRLAWGLM